MDSRLRGNDGVMKIQSFYESVLYKINTIESGWSRPIDNRCFYVPCAVVYHIGSATTGSRFNELTIRLSTRNPFYVLFKNYSLPLFLRFSPVICVY